MARKNKLQITPGWAIYLRTSTDESQAPERSQESQRRLIERAFLRHSDLPLIAEYRDIYSGRKTDRADYQRLLKDARQGKFSYVAVATVDRLGRNNGEIARAVDELSDLGIKVRLANFPDLDAANAGGRLIVNLLAAVAHFESDQTGERTVEGMLTKTLEGGWTFRAPDGYLNVEQRVGGKDSANGRYRRWIELDPDQAQVWRRAWQLLLEDQLTLPAICEDLHQRGYRLRSGASFITINKRGYRKPNTGALSRVFHNWFYAGWIVLKNDWANIPPKKMRGVWEPMVSTEDFERGLAILKRRSHTRDQKSKHFYLLTSLVFLERDGDEIRMIGSTPGARHPYTEISYYHAKGKPSNNIPCEIVDANLFEHLHCLQIREELLPSLEAAYTEHVNVFTHEKSDDRSTLEANLKRIDEEEERTARLFAAGRISEAVWNTLWAEWNDQRAKLQAAIDSLGAERELHLNNLASAIHLLANIGILYEKLEPQKRKVLLKQLVQKVVINQEGSIIRVELHPPFTYLRHLVSQVEGAGNLQENKISSTELDASNVALLGVLKPDKDEPLLVLYSNAIHFLQAIEYPQRAHLEPLLVAS